MAEIQLIRGGHIVCLDQAGTVYAGGDILIEDDIIVAVGAVPSEMASRATRVVDARNRIVFPGLVNGHSHSPLAYAKGAYDLANHRAALWMFQAFTAGRTRDEIYASTLLNCIEMLLTGTTAVIDHFPEQGFMLDDVEPVVAAYRDCGMRAIVALRIFDEPYRDIYPPDGEFSPELTQALKANDPLAVKPAKELLALCEAAIDRHHGRDGMIQIAPAPSNPMRCTDELLRGCQDLAVRRDTIVHCHLLETAVQGRIAQQRYGTTMVRHLDGIGVLTDRLSCAHTIWIDQDDIELMAARRSIVVHNPESNVRGGSGIAPIARMIKAGVPVAIGADGSPSGGNQALQHSMRLATIIGRPQTADLKQWVQTRDVMRMATEGGAIAMGLQGKIGALASGYRADLALYDLRSPWWTPLNDPVHQYVYCETGSSVTDVMIAGRWVVESRAIKTFDAGAVLAEAGAIFARIQERNAGLMKLSSALAAAVV
ncbi:MAG TPA: amidohydrolase family protein [Pseudolabrys sp.]|nr:amidohydrolase family protein [Pseudolabrys sp.]